MFAAYCTAFAYLGLLWIVGYVLCSAIIDRAPRHPLEIIGLSGLLGSAAIGTLLFWLSLAGLAPSRGLLWVIFAISMAALLLLKRQGRLKLLSWRRPKLTLADAWLLPLVLLIGWGLGAATYQTLHYSLADWDAFGVWGFRAKALYYDAIPNLHDYFHDLSLNFSPLDYPLLLPFLTAGGYSVMGEINEPLGKLAVLFMFWCFVFFIYGVARSLLIRPFALTLTAIAVCAPAVLHWGVLGVPDWPLAIFYAASLLYAMRWVQGGPRSDAWLAGLFSAAGVFIKNEGAPLAIFTLLAMIVWGRKMQKHWARDLILVAVVCIFSLLPWIIFRQSLPHVSENYPGHLNWATISDNSNRVPLLVRTFFTRMFCDWNWSLDWLLVAVVFMVTNWMRPSRVARILLLLLLAHLGLYLLVYEITPYSLDALLGPPLDRLLLHIWPTGVLLVLFSLERFMPSADHPQPKDTATQAGAGISNQNCDPAPS